MMNPPSRYRRFTPLLTIACCVLICSTTTATDWPSFRGPTGQGTSDDTNVPIQWNDDTNLSWKLELPGKGFSSPIVVKDYVFVTCYSEASGDLKDLARHLLCIDRHTGKIVWSKVVPSAAAEKRGPAFGTSHGYASHTPVSDGQHVYVFFGNTGVLAYDMAGRLLWQKSVGQENAAMFGSATSPILCGDRLIVTACAESKSIYALDKNTGKELWKTEAPDLSRSYCTPLAIKNEMGEDELLFSVPSEIWGLDPNNGELRWFAETRVDRNAVPSPVTRNGVIYIIGGRQGGRSAIRPSGEGDRTDSDVLWSTNEGSYVPSPVLYKDHLYWINDRGIAFCVDAKTGKEVAKKRIGGSYYASVVLVRDKLYAVSRYDGTRVIEATPELKQLAHNQLSDESDFSATPAVSDGQLFLRSDKYLFCVKADSKPVSP